MGRKRMARTTRGPVAGALVGSVILLGGLVAPAQAQSGGLDGSWRGGGSVAFGGGGSERAQCRAQFRRSSASSYTVTATCATASGRATQTATVRRVGGNSYQGTFHNSEYNTSGTIFITVAGNRQSVRLTGEAGSASLELRR
jgi:hypothetical protein